MDDLKADKLLSHKGTVQRISHDHGFKGFYKGLGPTILGYLPTWAIYFTVYDQVKAVLSSKRG